jgi:hypothetical protein
MSKLDALRGEAYESTTWRGHLIGPWTTGDRKVSTSACLWCSRTVTVRTRPMPNEINIGGEAVALNCEGRHTS